jgi:hypothetical protein
MLRVCKHRSHSQGAGACGYYPGYQQKRGPLHFPSTDAAESPFFVGETVILRCVFPGMPGEQTTRGEITDVRHSKDEWSMALRFAEPAWWVPPYH